MIFLSINPSKPLCIQAIGLLSASAGFAKRIQFVKHLLKKILNQSLRLLPKALMAVRPTWLFCQLALFRKKIEVEMDVKLRSTWT